MILSWNCMHIQYYNNFYCVFRMQRWIFLLRETFFFLYIKTHTLKSFFLVNSFQKPAEIDGKYPKRELSINYVIFMGFEY